VKFLWTIPPKYFTTSGNISILIIINFLRVLDWKILLVTCWWESCLLFQTRLLRVISNDIQARVEVSSTTPKILRLLSNRSVANSIKNYEK
jgi:hypothetical protein